MPILFFHGFGGGPLAFAWVQEEPIAGILSIKPSRLKNFP